MGRTPATRTVVTAAIALATALLMLLAACGGGASQEQAPAPTDSLLELMAYVPAARNYQQVCFASPRRYLDDAGFRDVRTVEQAGALMASQYELTMNLESLSPEEQDKLFTTNPVSLFWSVYASPYWSIKPDKLRQLFGLEYFQVEDYVTGSPNEFDVVRLPFDSEALAATLKAHGYGQEDYRGTPFYAIGFDSEPILTVDEKGIKDFTDLSSLTFARMNRVWLRDGTLVAAPATQILTDVIDTASGREPSILDRREYRDVAEGLGPLHAACLLDPARIRDGMERILSDVNVPGRRGELASRYPDWDRLDPPDLLALGYYRQPDGTSVFKVGLWYNDKKKAKANAPELQKRLAQYRSMDAFAKQLCDEAEVHSQTTSDGSLALAECRGGLARSWSYRSSSLDLFFLLERLPEQ